MCSAVLEVFGTVWTLSGQIHLVKSECWQSEEWTPLDSCSMTIPIGGVLANQRGVWEGQK